MQHSVKYDIEGKTITVKNLDKLIYEEKERSKEEASKTVTKAEIISYYIDMAKYILPHIYDKPFSMIHFPSGVGGESFYQKQCPESAPDWLKTVKLKSSTRGFIRWCLVNDLASIAYMAGRNVIEMHTWFSRLPNLDKPDIAVIDLDPSGETGFAEVAFIADAFGTLLNQLGIFSVPKTTGSRGVHIYIPIKNASFLDVKEFLNRLCFIVASTYPKLATTERAILRRGNRIYLDAVQNGEGKTIAAPYSLRARERLPVSTPVSYKELRDGVNPKDFSIFNALSRVQKLGDPFKDFYKKAQDLPKI